MTSPDAGSTNPPLSISELHMLSVAPSISGQPPISSGEPVVQQPLTALERADANTIQASIKSHFTFLIMTFCMFPNETEWHKLVCQACLHMQCSLSIPTITIGWWPRLSLIREAQFILVVCLLTFNFSLQRTSPQIIATQSRILPGISSLN